MTSGKTDDIGRAERMARVVGMRRRRVAWRDVAEDLGLSVRYVRDLYSEALAEVPVAEVDEHRAEELALYDDAVSELLELARDPDQTGRVRVDAYEALRGWCERKAKLLGLDAPTTVVTLDALDREIAQLSAELGVAAADEAADAPAASG